MKTDSSREARPSGRIATAQARRAKSGHVAKAAASALALVLLTALGPTAAQAAHGAALSNGIYRIPYADGTSVGVTNDSHNHSTAYDMSAGEDAQIVAAAGGWIRGIVDQHGEEPNPGDGVAIDGSTTDGNGDPWDDSLEHACLNEDPADIVGSCGDYNNYMWIEHPNGEYTKYSHLGTGTPTALGWSEGDWVNAGEVLGLENDVGAASSGDDADPGDRAFHLHWEVAVPNNPASDLTWGEDGGFIQNGARIQAVVCDIPGNDLLAGNNYTANPCTNQTPTADAGGPYVVDEGSTIMLDGTGSSDPDGTPLTYAWAPEDDLDDPSLAQPTYTAVDDVVNAPYTLTVYDQVEAASDSDGTTVTVNNVAPTVNAAGDTIHEGEAATVSATFADPGAQDTHTAAIDWGDGSPVQAVTTAQLLAGVDHDYGDNGSYQVDVTVTDDDGGSGMDTATVQVGNLDPAVAMDLSGQISFPGGDYFILMPGQELALAADGEDPGSDDLTFDWSTGEANTYFNNGVSPDLFPSPDGTFPFAASDAVANVLGDAQVQTIGLTLSDDDGGQDTAEAGAIVTGAAEDTEGSGWWKHQLSGSGAPHIDPATAQAYLDIVGAVSSVFSEQVAASTPSEAHAVLSPTGGDPAAAATAELLAAWLHFASGAVGWDAVVTLQGGSTIGFLDLMFQAEQTILTSTSKAELKATEQDLARVRHAG